MENYFKFSPKLIMWYEEAHKEKSTWKYYIHKLLCKKINSAYAIYPRRYYRHVVLNQQKSFNYCFIGGYKTDEKTFTTRQWLMNFVKERFDNESYLQFTDHESRASHVSLGLFDYTLEKEGMVPKEMPCNMRNIFDENYFTVMAKSKFCLCPAGDKPWSMRFYESLMCKAIPIVNSKEHTYRSQEEHELDYKYYLRNEVHVYREDWAEHNFRIFCQNHTLD